jgi:hypothetical protein
MANLEYSRIIIKRSTIPTQVPTVPAVDDLNTFNATDIFEGELFYNVPDEILYTRTGSTIVQLTGLGCCDLEDTLSAGNTTNGNNIEITSGDLIRSVSGKATLALDTITAKLVSFDGIVGDASITMDYTTGVDMYYLNGSSSLLSQIRLLDGYADLRTYANGISCDNSGGNNIVTIYSNDPFVTGSSYINIEPGSIILSKDSTIATDVMKLEITNTRMNFSGAATNLINIHSNILPAHADDATAGGAGLATGDLYQTDGTGAAPLNVPGIVMIKQ